MSKGMSHRRLRWAVNSVSRHRSCRVFPLCGRRCDLYSRWNGISSPGTDAFQRLKRNFLAWNQCVSADETDF
jgi:diadenosine tetraphosphatase ApaH/serine/threonine PP2A family protein phosphatase